MVSEKLIDTINTLRDIVAALKKKYPDDVSIPDVPAALTLLDAEEDDQTPPNELASAGSNQHEWDAFLGGKANVGYAENELPVLVSENNGAANPLIYCKITSYDWEVPATGNPCDYDGSNVDVAVEYTINITPHVDGPSGSPSEFNRMIVLDVKTDDVVAVIVHDPDDVSANRTGTILGEAKCIQASSTPAAPWLAGGDVDTDPTGCVFVTVHELTYSDNSTVGTSGTFGTLEYNVYLNEIGEVTAVEEGTVRSIAAWNSGTSDATITEL